MLWCPTSGTYPVSATFELDVCEQFEIESSLGGAIRMIRKSNYSEFLISVTSARHHIVNSQSKMICQCDVYSISTNSSIFDVESTAIYPQNRRISIDSISKRLFEMSI